MDGYAISAWSPTVRLDGDGRAGQEPRRSHPSWPPRRRVARRLPGRGSWQLAGERKLELMTLQRFPAQERVCQAVENSPLFDDHATSLHISLVDETADLRID